jgi:hypothetical protein
MLASQRQMHMVGDAGLLDEVAGLAKRPVLLLSALCAVPYPNKFGIFPQRADTLP